ncbi:MAG: hypothetical protein OXN89_01785 [Bryobacterales bacterium]|nr:hypothetical protein [Bryobacterales bacterium]
MTRDDRAKPFDCVKWTREVGDQIGAEIKDMSCDGLRQWLDAAVQRDPFFSRIPTIRPSVPARDSQDLGSNVPSVR